MDSNDIIETCVSASFVPTLIMRLISFIFYRKRDPLDFKTNSQRIYVFQHATYGIWTLYHLMAFMNVNINCKKLLVMNMINFEAVLIVGCFSAVHVLFVAFILMIILPVFCYQEYKRHQQRTLHTRRTKTLLSSLVTK